MKTPLTINVQHFEVDGDEGWEAVCPELQIDSRGATPPDALLMMADQLFAMTREDYVEPVAFGLEANGRGFQRSDFPDANGDACSIQESNAIGDGPTGARIWLGMNTGTHAEGDKCMARMHLTQAHVVALLPLLHHFAATGRLG